MRRRDEKGEEEEEERERQKEPLNRPSRKRNALNAAARVSTRERARPGQMSSRRGSERCHHRVILQQIGLHSIRWREATYEAIQPCIAAG